MPENVNPGWYLIVMGIKKVWREDNYSPEEIERATIELVHAFTKTTNKGEDENENNRHRKKN